MCRKTANINFHYRRNSVKINDKIFQYLKKPWFWTIFGPSFQILGQNFFFWKIWLSHTTSHGFQAPCQNLGKTNNTVPTKHLDRRMDSGTKRTEGQTDPISFDSSSYWRGSKNIGEYPRNYQSINFCTLVCPQKYFPIIDFCMLLLCKRIWYRGFNEIKVIGQFLSCLEAATMKCPL